MIWIRLTALYASRSACSRSVCASLLLPALGASRSVCDRSVCDGSVCVQRSLCLCSLCMRWLGPRSVCMRWACRRWLWVSLTTLPTFQPTNQFKVNLRIIDGISILDKSQNLDGWFHSCSYLRTSTQGTPSLQRAEPSARRPSWRGSYSALARSALARSAPLVWKIYDFYQPNPSKPTNPFLHVRMIIAIVRLNKS